MDREAEQRRIRQQALENQLRQLDEEDQITQSPREWTSEAPPAPASHSSLALQSGPWHSQQPVVRIPSMGPSWIPSIQRQQSSYVRHVRQELPNGLSHSRSRDDLASSPISAQRSHTQTAQPRTHAPVHPMESQLHVPAQSAQSASRQVPLPSQEQVHDYLIQHMKYPEGLNTGWSINGVVFDVYRLFSAVITRGGSTEVSGRDAWTMIGSSIGLSTGSDVSAIGSSEVGRKLRKFFTTSLGGLEILWDSTKTAERADLSRSLVDRAQAARPGGHSQRSLDTVPVAASSGGSHAPDMTSLPSMRAKNIHTASLPLRVGPGPSFTQTPLVSPVVRQASTGSGSSPYGHPTSAPTITTHKLKNASSFNPGISGTSLITGRSPSANPTFNQSNHTIEYDPPNVHDFDHLVASDFLPLPAPGDGVFVPCIGTAAQYYARRAHELRAAVRKRSAGDKQQSLTVEEIIFWNKLLAILRRNQHLIIPSVDELHEQESRTKPLGSRTSTLFPDAIQNRTNLATSPAACKSSNVDASASRSGYHVFGAHSPMEPILDRAHYSGLLFVPHCSGSSLSAGSYPSISVKTIASASHQIAPTTAKRRQRTEWMGAEIQLNDPGGRSPGSPFGAFVDGRGFAVSSLSGISPSDPSLTLAESITPSLLGVGDGALLPKPSTALAADALRLFKSREIALDLTRSLTPLSPVDSGPTKPGKASNTYAARSSRVSAKMKDNITTMPEGFDRSVRATPSMRLSRSPRRVIHLSSGRASEAHIRSQDFQTPPRSAEIIRNSPFTSGVCLSAENTSAMNEAPIAIGRRPIPVIPAPAAVVSSISSSAMGQVRQVGRPQLSEAMALASSEGPPRVLTQSASVLPRRAKLDRSRTTSPARPKTAFKFQELFTGSFSPSANEAVRAAVPDTPTTPKPAMPLYSPPSWKSASKGKKIVHVTDPSTAIARSANRLNRDSSSEALSTPGRRLVPYVEIIRSPRNAIKTETQIRLPLDRVKLVLPIRRSRRTRLIAKGYYEAFRDDASNDEYERKSYIPLRQLKPLPRGSLARTARPREPEVIPLRFLSRPGPGVIQPFKSILEPKTMLLRTVEHLCNWKGCDAVLASEEHLRRHVNFRNHADQGKIQAGIYGQESLWRCFWRGCEEPCFTTERKLEQHMAARHISRVLGCPYPNCDLVSPTISHLSRHVMKQHDEIADQPRPLADLSQRLSPHFPIPLRPVPDTARTDELTTPVIPGSTYRASHRQEWVKEKVQKACFAGPEPIVHVEHPPHILQPLEESASAALDPTSGGIGDETEPGVSLLRQVLKKRRLQVFVELPAHRLRTVPIERVALPRDQ